MNDLGFLVWLAGGNEDGAKRLTKAGVVSFQHLAMADPDALRLVGGLSEAGARWLSRTAARLATELEGLNLAPVDEEDLVTLALEDLAMTAPALEGAAEPSGASGTNTWERAPRNGPTPHPAEAHTGLVAKETRKTIGGH